jgi:phage terminase Nu1 subunit (DNA packaging protein)
VNSSDNLAKQQRQFLEEMAKRYNFKGDTRTVFLFRFDPANDSKDNTRLAEAETDQIEWNREPEDKRQKLQDELANICQVLEQHGYPIEKPKRGRQPKGKSPWEQASKWLWEKEFPKCQPRQILDVLSEEEQKEAVCRFLQNIEDKFKNVYLLHRQEQPIVLKDQYIPIQVTLERKYTHAVETTWGYAESEAEMKRAYALKGLEESQPSPVDWKEAKKQHQRIIVLADPGMGKSTLLRREACLTAQEERQSLKDNTKKLEEVVFPLFLRLSDLAETPEEIIDAIPVLIQRDYSDTATEVMELLREKLKIGKCLLLLDALDEVPPEQRQRQRLFEKLNRFAEREYPCRIICTSRIVGYSGAFVQGTKEVEIVPFSRTQTEQYIETWFRNVAGYLNEDTVSASSLIRELRNKPQLGGLAQNPLLLSLICTLYQEKGLTLPARRCQVYEQAVRYMLGKWRKKRNPQSEGRIIAKTRLLEELAYHFTREGQDIFLKDDLYDQIETYLQQERVPTVFRDDDTDKLMMELSEEDGILQKLHEDGDQYLFLHRTFQEYLTACYLNRASDSIALAKEHFWEYEWHETLSLLAGLMENPVPLLQAITAEKDDIFSTLLLLAGRCIAECPENPHPLIAEIIDKIYKFWQSYPNAGFSKSIVVAIGQVNSQIFSRLQTDRSHSDINVRSQAAVALGKVRGSQAAAELINDLIDSDTSFSFSALAALTEIETGSLDEIKTGSLEAVPGFIKSLIIYRSGRFLRSQEAELINALHDSDRKDRWGAAGALRDIGTKDTLAKLIQLPEIDIRDPVIFPLARTLAVRASLSKEKLPFIPVYPELVAHKQ